MLSKEDSESRGSEMGSQSGLSAFAGLIGRLFKHLDRALLCITGALLFLVLVVVLLQVIMRYVFHAPTVWSEELATLLFVWFVMLGIPTALHHRQHIRVEVLTEIPSKNLSRILHVFGNLMFIAVFAFLLYYSAELMPLAERQLLSGISQAFKLEIHMDVIVWALPVGSALTVLFALEQIAKTPYSDIASDDDELESI